VVQTFGTCDKRYAETLEAAVCGGTIDIYPNGSVSKSFEKDGDADNIYKFSEFNYTIFTKGFYGNEESI